MAKEFKTAKTADAAARRELRKIHGQSYMPKVGVDFLVSRQPWWGSWRFEIINR